jgi:hypothetical protein
LMGQFPNDDLLLLWNIGCPMDYLDQAGRKSEWERMAGVAMELHRGVSNPASVALLAEVTARVNSFVVPPRFPRVHLVLHAGRTIVALSSAQAKPKNSPPLEFNSDPRSWYESIAAHNASKRFAVQRNLDRSVVLLCLLEIHDGSV